jgi:hydroxymethylpyrimidine pyrophosphatase-like HAD family hydrolase
MYPNTPYRLAVFDMDGTLLGPDGHVSEANVRALHRLRDSGVEVVIASGRHHSEITIFEQRLGFQSWVISAGGAVIRHAATQELLYKMNLPEERVAELIQRGQQIGARLIGYHDLGVLSDHPAKWNGLDRAGWQKLIWMHAPEQIAHLTGAMEREYQERLYVVCTGHTSLEFLHVQVNKALATQILAEKLGLTSAQVVAFGDGNNDVPLLAWGGMSVAMHHGEESAKRSAKQISPPGPPETAVARGIELVLGTC